MKYKELRNIIVNLEDARDSLIKDNERLQKSVKYVENGNALLESRNAALQGENEELKKELHTLSLSSGNSSLIDRVESLQIELVDSGKEIDSLQNRLKCKLSDNYLKTRNAELEKRHDTQRDVNDKLVRKVTKLEEWSNDRDKTISQLSYQREKSSLEMMGLRSQLKESERQNEEQVKTIVRYGYEVRTLKSNNQVLETICKNQAEAVNQYQKNTSDLKGEINKLKDANSSLKKKEEELEDTCKSKDEYIRVRKARISALKCNNSSLRKKVHVLGEKHLIELEEVKRDNYKLERKLREANEVFENGTNNSLQESESFLKSEVDRITTVNADLHKVIKELRENVSTGLEKNQDLRERVIGSDATIRHISSEYSKLHEKHYQLTILTNGVNKAPPLENIFAEEPGVERIVVRASDETYIIELLNVKKNLEDEVKTLQLSKEKILKTLNYILDGVKGND